MTISLRITLIVFSLFLIIVTTYILEKGRIPEKYSLLWYFIALVILLVALFPSLFSIIATNFGFQVMSNLVIGIILGLFTFLTMALTIIAAGQKKKITLLIQEISILKEKTDKDEKKQ